MAESEEALQLKRRARRRLVGAIALVTFVVILLPLILDKEPGPPGPPLSVQIPAQETGGFAPQVQPSVPDEPAPQEAQKAAQPEAVKAAPPVAKVAPVPEVKAVVPAAESKPIAAPGKDEETRAKAALNDEAWVISLVAVSDKSNVSQLRSKLKAAGIKSFTEPVKTSKGELTRVRAGPYASKEAAEKIHAKLVALGLKPGAVVRQ